MGARTGAALGCVTLVAALACTRPDNSAVSADSSRVEQTTGSTDATAAAPTSNSPTPSAPSAWTVSAAGLGPVRAGMTIAEAGRVLGTALSVSPEAASCAYVRPAGVPPGVSFMIVDGRVARVNIDSGSVRTTAGAGIGDGEARIRSLYPGRVEVQPHKYTDGHYLVVTPSAPDDSTTRIIFETDGQRVTRYRAGRLPMVAWVEGCA